MKYNISDNLHNLQFDNLLEALSRCRVMNITPMMDDKFYIQECCDDYFFVVLNKDQLIALGKEIIELAERPFKPILSEVSK